MVESAINPDANLPLFIQTFKTNFPVGASDNSQVRAFMQIPMMERAFVPFMVIIDRQGVIRVQHTGSDQEYFTDDTVKQTTNIRADVGKLLAESPPKPARKTHAKSAAKSH